MKLFISYSSSRQAVCEPLRLALEAEGHSVFADRADLRAGEGYHETLREAIQAADCLIFLVSPESVAPGSYTLAELSIAEQRWRRPAGHVLPVLIAPTELSSIPAYLRAVTLLQPKGNVVAETVAAVARLQRPRRRTLLGMALLTLALALGIGGHFWQQRTALEHERRLEADREAQRLRQAVATALQLCTVGDFALGWQQLEPLGDATAREDCGMRWLRAARVTVGQDSFSALADRIKPVLARGLAAATGQRAADLRAHLGWADFLRSRDGAAVADPAASYERALQDDPGNGYAQAMLAHGLIWRSSSAADEAARRFDAALKDPRDHAFTRALQLAAYGERPPLWPRLLPVLDQMRSGGESLPAERRDRLFRTVFVDGLVDPSRRRETLAALPPPHLLETFDWLLPPQRGDLLQRQVDFGRAALLANTGDIAAARSALEALQRRLRADRASGSFVDETDKLLRSLGPAK